MQKRFYAALCALLLVFTISTAYGEGDGQETAPYTGVVSRELSVREEQSKSAKRYKGSMELTPLLP